LTINHALAFAFACESLGSLGCFSTIIFV